MKIYFSSNIGGGEDKYEILYLLFANIKNRLFSYFYHKNCSGMKLYFAGYGKGGGEIKDDEYTYNVVKYGKNKLFSFYRDKRVMKLYFAGGENKSWLKAIEKANGHTSLYSYYFLNKNDWKKNSEFIIKANNSQKNIFIDSGAFSAQTQGIKIDIYDYIKWITENKKHLTVYANLDVIGNAEKTLENQKIMEKKGLNPLPCYHVSENLNVLNYYCKNYNYIAIGGMVPYARQGSKLKQILDNCFNTIKKYPKIKIHGFGMTNIKFLLRYPFYSVDSTSWLGGSMRAEIYEFKNGDIKSLSTSNINKSSHKNFSYTDNNDKKWMLRVIKNCIEWQKAEKYVTEVWKERGVVWND